MARTLLYGDSGMDCVFSTEKNLSSVGKVISLIQERIDLVGEPVPILVEAKLSPSQCREVLNAFPAYSRCFQESGTLVIIDHETTD